MLKRSITFVAMYLASLLAWAEEPAPGAAAPPATGTTSVQLPAWMTPDVIKAAVALHLTPEQSRTFNEAVGEFVTDHFAMIQKEFKREAPDLDQRVKSRDAALVHELDGRVDGILTKEQMPAYESYKKALRAGLKSAPLPQGSTGTRSMHGVGGGQG